MSLIGYVFMGFYYVNVDSSDCFVDYFDGNCLDCSCSSLNNYYHKIHSLHNDDFQTFDEILMVDFPYAASVADDSLDSCYLHYGSSDSFHYLFVNMAYELSSAEDSYDLCYEPCDYDDDLVRGN